MQLMILICFTHPFTTTIVHGILRSQHMTYVSLGEGLEI